MLLDSHCHLDDSAFDVDRVAVIERARAAGVRYILVAGGATGPDRLDSSLAVITAHEWMYASVGLHPHEAKYFTDAHAERIVELAQHPRVVAIGEIGLDYFYDHSPREVQQQVLIRQMELARVLKLPIIIHCRDAWADLLAIADAHWRSSGLGGILHCFTGSVDDARPFLNWGFQISFAGNLTYRKAQNLREAARLIPLDRLLTETDCPYLAPIPHRGRRNEPSYVRAVTEALARIQQLTVEDLAGRVTENFEKFLTWRSARTSQSA